jgi:hypothetical protein
MLGRRVWNGQRCLLAAFLFFLFCGFDHAWASGIGFQPVSQDELKMTSEPAAPGAAAVILYRQVDVDDNGQTSHEDNYLRIKILTEEGRKYGDVEIPYRKGETDVVNVHARTIRPDGSSVEYDGKVFEKTIAKARGIKVETKTFALPDVQVGSIIEYFYTVDMRAFYLFEPRWVVSDVLFTKHAKFTMKPYERAGWYWRWNWQGLPQGVTPKEDGPQHIVTVVVDNVPAFREEEYMPPEYEMKARVDFTVQKYVAEREPDKFWKSVGKEKNGALESFVGKKSAMEQAVSQIVAPNDPPEVKLRKMYDKVQGMRNTSYEFRKSEQEEKRDNEKPVENVAELWSKGYGSGQQLTWLFLALARAAGFEAYGCWVADRSNYFFNPAWMQERKLDANVALVKVDGKDEYFDPGAKFAPYGLLEWSETGVPGLRLDKDGGTWITTPLPASSDSKIERTGTLQLTDTGDLEGKLTVTYTGLEAMYHRQQMRHADDTEKKKHLEDTLKEQIPVGADADLANKPDWASASAPLVAEYNLKVPGWAASAGKHATIPAGIFTAREQHAFEHSERLYPIYFDYPHQKIDEVTIALPAGWRVETVPPGESLDKKLLDYELKVENKGTTLHLTRKLSVDTELIEQKYYPAVQHFYQAVRSGDEQQIVLQPGAATAAN